MVDFNPEIIVLMKHMKVTKITLYSSFVCASQICGVIQDLYFKENHF